MPDYELSLSKPAPMFNVVIYHPVTGAGRFIRAKMDTGADTTVLPENLLQQVGLTSVRTTTAIGFNGVRTQHPVYFARISVDSFAFPLVRCIGVHYPHALIGRDILNKLIITLDGPNLIVTASEP